MENFLSNPEVVSWLIILVIALIAEAATATLFSIWFAIGALAALIIVWVGLPVWLQIVVFWVVSGIVLLITKPLTEKMINQKTVKTNADRIIGSYGIVKADINNIAATGLVEVSGQSWSARSASGLPIAIGTTVIIKEIDGVKLLVEPAEDKMNEA